MQRPSDIDVVYVFGYAFPVAKGGPMFYADQVGLKMCMTKFASFVTATASSTGNPHRCLNSWQKRVRLLLNGTEKGVWRNAVVSNRSAGYPVT